MNPERTCSENRSSVSTQGVITVINLGLEQTPHATSCSNLKIPIEKKKVIEKKTFRIYQLIEKEDGLSWRNK